MTTLNQPTKGTTMLLGPEAKTKDRVNQMLDRVYDDIDYVIAGLRQQLADREQECQRLQYTIARLRGNIERAGEGKKPKGKK